jgi:hypothetical protein
MRGPRATGDSDSEQKGFLDTIKDNAGLLLVAFIGAANFIGISSGEIPNILRNEEGAANFTAVLIALAAIAAVMSAIPKEDKEVSLLWYIPAILGVTTIFFWALTGIRLSQSGALYRFLDGVVIALAVCTVVAILMVSRLRKKCTRKGDAKLFIFLLAVFLTIVAIYASLRVETQSQTSSNQPRLTAATIAGTGSGDKTSLAATVNASRVAAGNIVEMTVYAYEELENKPRAEHPHVNEKCLQKNQCDFPECHETVGCIVVSDSISEPDPNGNVSSKITAPVPGRAYYLIITGVIHQAKEECQKTGTSTSCLTSTVTLNVTPDP